MEEQYYKTVIVKSPADYPKVEGDYFCCWNGFKAVHHLIPDDGNKSYMVKELRWYLQPVKIIDNKTIDFGEKSYTRYPSKMTEEEYCRILGK